MQLWNTEWNVWMKMSIPPIFCPNPPRTSTDISPIFCPSGHCTALQPGSSWAPLAPEKWLPRWTGKKWWQRSTRDLYLPYFCTKARRARGTGGKDRGRGADKSRNRNYAELILCKFTKSFPERPADSIGLRTGKALKKRFKKLVERARAWSCRSSNVSTCATSGKLSAESSRLQMKNNGTEHRPRVNHSEIRFLLSLFSFPTGALLNTVYTSKPL